RLPSGKGLPSAPWPLSTGDTSGLDPQKLAKGGGGGPGPQLRWRRQRRVTRWAGRPRARSLSPWRRGREDGAGGAGAVPQPGEGQRAPLPPAAAARRAALPCRALRLRPLQGAAGRRVRALPAQKEAWLDHKQECRCLKSIVPNFPPDSVRLAGRIVFKLLRQSMCLSERLYSFSDLQSNIEQLSEEMKDGLRHLAQTLQLYLKTEIQDASHLPPAIDFFQIFTKVSVKM
uniref:Uncharacterized protein n=1 Tax=Falco tinnunculus TaxID=100819 RepID=A0A8C4TZZ5_FALTI